MKYELIFKQWIASALGLAMTGLLTSCGPPYQSVQGAHATPNKRVSSAVVGGTAGTILASGTVGLATAGGAGLGLLATQSKTSLQKTLSEQGVNVIAQGDSLRLILPSDQFFYPGSPALQPPQYPVLTNVAALLKEYGKVPITIAAYTDSIGSPHEHVKLSQQQAESMRAYFWVHGIEHQHLKTVGYGEQFPVAQNKGTGYAANRRVEITLKAM